MQPHQVEDYLEEEGSSTVDLKILLLYGAFRFKFWILSAMALGLMVGLIYAGAMPNEYQSVAQIKLLPDERGGMSPAQQMGVAGEMRRYSGPGIADQIRWLEANRRGFEGVAKDMGPSFILAPADPSQYDGQGTSLAVRLWHRLQSHLIGFRAHDPDQIDDESPSALLAAVEALRANTQLAATSDWVFNVIHKANSADRAEQINFSLVEAFIEAHMQSLASANGALISQLKQKEILARDDVTAIDDAFQLYRQDCGVFDFETEWASVTVRVTQLESDLERARTESKGQEALVFKFKEDYALMPENIEVVVPPVVETNPLWVSLQNRITELNLDLVDLRSGPASKLTKQDIGRAERRLEAVQENLGLIAETTQTQPERTEVVPNEARASIQVKIIEAEAVREQQLTRVSNLERALVELIARRTKIMMCREGHAEYNGKLGRAKAKLDQLANRRMQSERYADLDADRMSNLQLWSAPTNSPEKVGPSRAKPVLAATAAGAALGLLLAALRQLLDRNVRYPETLENSLGVKILGVVPELRQLRNQPKGPTAA